MFNKNQSSSTTHFRVAALALAAKGFRVFPCKPGTKKPLGGHGHHDATTSTKTIQKWWTQTPKANVAIACGASGFAVIDVDPRNGGTQTLIELETKRGALPRTVEAKTGGKDGGRHLYYRAPPGRLVGKLGNGVDLKNDGYTIAPPSVHPDGGIYRWEVSPFDAEVAELPAAWIALMTKDGPKKPPNAYAPKGNRTGVTTSVYGHAAVERKIKAVEAACEGERNATLNRAAFALGQLHAGGEIADVREDLVQAGMDAGLPESEARATVNSGWNAGMLEPRSAPAKDGDAAVPAQISAEEMQRLQTAWAQAQTAMQLDSLVRALSEVAKQVGYSEEDVVELVEELAAAVGDKQVQLRVAQVEEVYRAPSQRVGGWGVLRQFGLTPTNLPSFVSPAEAERDSMAARLVGISEEIEIICDERGDAYAFIKGLDGNQLLPVRGGAFKGFLSETAFERWGQVPGSESIRAASTIIEVRARRGLRVPLGNRVARGEDGAIWLDMADKTGRAIKVTCKGWEIVERSPPLFRRYAHQQPLPIPVRGGNAWKILEFVNLSDPKDQVLFVISTVVALVPDIPQPLMIFVGPQGSAKTSAARARRRIVDPSATPTLITKNDPGELVLVLDQHYLPILDNVTSIAGWYSDILCQAVTGGSFAKRQLFTDQDQVLLTFRRPITITALALPHTPADLPDRALLLNFDRVDPSKRLRERDLWTKFEAELPSIFGGMLDLLVHAMACEDTIKLPELPRLADFCQWGAAAASAIEGGKERFLDALSDNSAQRDIAVTDDDVVGAAIRRFAEGLASPWRGSPTELLSKLVAVPGGHTQSRAWPRQAAGLTKRLTSLQSVLASQGILVRWSKTRGNRYWEVTRRDLQDNDSTAPSAPSAPSEPKPTKDTAVPGKGEGDAGGDRGRVRHLLDLLKRRNSRPRATVGTSGATGATNSRTPQGHATGATSGATSKSDSTAPQWTPHVRSSSGRRSVP
jgi:hypothetical protein